MALPGYIEFEALIEPVACRLLGQPNPKLSRPPKELRFGTHGSISVDLTKGVFFDHECNIGGGVLNLIRHKTGLDHIEAVSWLRSQGLLHELQSSGPERSLNANASWQRSRTTETAIYQYVDEAGTLLFEVVRFEPKQFRQRRPCPDEPGIWIWGLNAGEYMRSGPGRDWITFDEKRFAAWPPTKETKNFGAVRRVPYRFPEVLEAIAQGHEVYIVEGEKDCTNLAALGFTATTNPGGAEKWRDEYNEYFCGAEVVIIGDNDHPGRRHVEGIATSLYRIAKRVRVGDLVHVWPECPEKGDVSDWINKVGGTADQLKAFVQSLPDWEPQKPVVNVGRSEWPKMDEAGYYGLAGDVVKTIEPHSEADPNAILIQFLVAVGNAIGRGPFYKVEGDYHYTKLFVVLVGTTSEGRKGTSLGRVLQIMEQADPDWTQYRVQSGLVSGEGLVHLAILFSSSRMATWSR